MTDEDGNPPGLKTFLTKCPHCGYIAAIYANAITWRVKCERHIDPRHRVHMEGCGQMFELSRANAIPAIWRKRVQA